MCSTHLGSALGSIGLFLGGTRVDVNNNQVFYSPRVSSRIYRLVPWGNHSGREQVQSFVKSLKNNFVLKGSRKNFFISFPLLMTTSLVGEGKAIGVRKIKTTFFTLYIKLITSIKPTLTTLKDRP